MDAAFVVWLNTYSRKPLKHAPIYVHTIHTTSQSIYFEFWDGKKKFCCTTAQSLLAVKKYPELFDLFRCVCFGYLFIAFSHDICKLKMICGTSFDLSSLQKYCIVVIIKISVATHKEKRGNIFVQYTVFTLWFGDNISGVHHFQFSYWLC